MNRRYIMESVAVRQLRPADLFNSDGRLYKAWRVIPDERNAGVIVLASRPLDRNGGWEPDTRALFFRNPGSITQRVIT